MQQPPGQATGTTAAASSFGSVLSLEMKDFGQGPTTVLSSLPGKCLSLVVRGIGEHLIAY